MLLDWRRTGKITAVGAATGIVVGLVAVTPAAGFIGPMAAIALGAVAALPSYFGILWRSKTRLDDSLDVVAAHGLGGTTGALLTGVLAAAAWGGSPGLLEGNARQLGVQAIAVLATLAYSAAASYALLKIIGWVSALAAEPRSQGRGLDIELHGEEAYSNGEGAILVLPESKPEAEQPVALPSPAPSVAGG
jgi:Amt family ammonium transporter